MIHLIIVIGVIFNFVFFHANPIIIKISVQTISYCQFRIC